MATFDLNASWFTGAPTPPTSTPLMSGRAGALLSVSPAPNMQQDQMQQALQQMNARDGQTEGEDLSPYMHGIA